eukprot:scaffold17121_cov122-Isochrysis_galbana.AAC.5
MPQRFRSTIYYDLKSIVKRIMDVPSLTLTGLSAFGGAYHAAKLILSRKPAPAHPPPNAPSELANIYDAARCVVRACVRRCQSPPVSKAWNYIAS